MNNQVPDCTDPAVVKPLVVVMGPTASGKSAFAVQLAHIIKGEIISADSAQVYEELQIITARTKTVEMEGIPHHLTGFIHLDTPFSVTDFQELAYKTIREILARGNVPILTGGTTLYVKAVTEAYNLPEVPPDPEIREELNRRAKQEGKGALYRELQELDPDAAEKMHPHNLPRVIRALEVILKTGKKFSDFYTKISPHPLGVQPYYIRVDIPREQLYHRIDARVDCMIEQGALEEIQHLVTDGYKEQLETSKILGARELLGIIEGKYSQKEGIDQLKRNTRRYAKRQLTWLNSFEGVHEIQLTPGKEQEIVQEVKESLHKTFPCSM